MFKFLQRAFAPSKPAAPPSRARKKPVASFDSAPAPLPEVTEGNGEADWSLWQDSVNQMDSQFMPASEFRETEPASVDAYRNVSKKDP